MENRFRGCTYLVHTAAPAKSADVTTSPPERLCIRAKRRSFPVISSRIASADRISCTKPAHLDILLMAHVYPLCHFAPLFFVLALTAIIIVRHVRSSRTSTHRQRDFTRHLFAAAADQDSRRPGPSQQQSVKGVLSRMRYQAPRLQACTGNQSTSSKPF